MRYIAEIRGKSGQLLFQGHPFDCREEAARYVFRNGPQSRDLCSTSGAYLDPSGNWRSNGTDIRWHKRRDYFRDVDPCDHGLFGDAAAQIDICDLLSAK